MKKLQGINHIVTKRSGSVWVGNMIQSWCPNVSFTKFENVYPITFHNAAQSGVCVLQTRDLLNWYASYITVKKGVNFNKQKNIYRKKTKFFVKRMRNNLCFIFRESFIWA